MVVTDFYNDHGRDATPVDASITQNRNGVLSRLENKPVSSVQPQRKLSETIARQRVRTTRHKFRDNTGGFEIRQS